MGITAVTGVNFSLFFGECPVAQAINLKKSLKTVEFFQEAGLEVIPHIYFTHSNHLHRWTEWLKKNKIRVIAINCQFSRDHEMAPVIANGIKFLNDNVGYQMSFLLEGPSRFLLRKLRNIDCLSSVRVAMKGPSLDARFGQSYIIDNDDKLAKISIQNATIEEVLSSNLKVFRNYIGNLIGNNNPYTH